jgi:ubiquinone/menaquinone biosynthesis C-methylase UbiE
MGDFLKDLIALLPEYTFKTIAIDVNADDLEKNKADQKIVSNLTKIEVPDRSVDIVICRYTLAWNNLETQREILREIKRISKGLVVIQHQGANSLNPEVLQKASKELFSGVIPQLKRDAFFFSTAEQLEVFMKELEITFERIQDKTVNGLSGLFIDKYGLSDTEADEVKRILKDSDYLTLSSWVLKL